MNKFTVDPNTKFLDPEKVLFAAGLNSGQVLADLGAGGGFYSFAASKIVGDTGSIYAVDVLEPTLDHVASEARVKGLRNIKTIRADLENPDGLSEIPTGSVDMVLFANILHQIKDKKSLLAIAYRLLKTHGRLVVIEWNDQPSPIGPTPEDRIPSSEVSKLISSSNLKQAGMLATDAYHYGLIFIK
jgi:ubiquinone/menaquinone biosynthesis C-methylase UbiE